MSCNGSDLALDTLGLPDDTPFLPSPTPVGVPALRIAEGQRHAAVAGAVSIFTAYSL